MPIFIKSSLIALACVVYWNSALEASLVTDNSDTDDDVRQFCQLETMTARCRWNSEVIVMTSARWGRMRTGRCLSIHPDLMAANGRNPLFLGCSADVLDVLDRKCSGRSECDVRIPDPELDNVKPCYPDLKNHLEASYTCVRVVQESRTCKVQATVDPQYISSSALSPTTDANPASSSSCGAVSHPWRLEAAAGQRINISLIDFEASSAASGNGPSRDVGDVTGSGCRQYGYVVEKWNRKNVSLCVEGGAEQRQRAVYSSESNNVEIVLTTGPGGNNNFKFLLKLQAVGCTNLVPPDNAWLKRSNNDIIIGCYSSQQTTWRLQCDGHNWKGTIGTCPELYVGPAVEEKNIEEPKKHDPKHLLVMVVAIGVAALIVCLSVICIGCLCLRRYKFSEMKKSSGPLLNVSADNWTHTDNNVFLQGPTTTTAAAAGTQQLNQPQNYSDIRQQTHNTQYRAIDNNEHC